ncbi:MAG: type II toxin-antitoxin system PemK/MazF family toxin [Bacteriovoracaceae bacterium]|nr:type II toxin-antitoxin system PemK/MazF family toxin [Bacteriovoracaceae bacterium]
MQNSAKYQRGDVWEVILDPTKGSEQRGTRPCVVVSHEVMNSALTTLVMVPLSTKIKEWPTRVDIKFLEKPGQALCEQIRTVSQDRLTKKLGELNLKEIAEVRIVLRQMFFD